MSKTWKQSRYDQMSDARREVRVIERQETGELVPTGARGTYAKMVRELVERENDKMREAFAGEFEGESATALYVKSVMQGVKERDRTCMRLFAEIRGAVIEQQQYLIEIWHRLGVRDEGEAEAKLGRMKNIEGMSLRESAERCLDMAVKYGDVDEDFRVSAIKRLGGLVEV